MEHHVPPPKLGGGENKKRAREEGEKQTPTFIAGGLPGLADFLRNKKQERAKELEREIMRATAHFANQQRDVYLHSDAKTSAKREDECAQQLQEAIMRATRNFINQEKEYDLVISTVEVQIARERGAWVGVGIAPGRAQKGEAAQEAQDDPGQSSAVQPWSSERFHEWRDMMCRHIIDERNRNATTPGRR